MTRSHGNIILIGILAVDWFLDRFRTATNVWGDSAGATCIDRMTSQVSQ